MARTRIMELGEFGQSIWLDYISRPLLEQGRLKEMIALGVRGVTSNPAIFNKAIGCGADYDAGIAELSRQGKSPPEIYDALTVKDIREAADLFRPVYEQTKGLDGYVSLEVNPKFAFDAVRTIEDGRRLYQKVSRPNVMFKIPATEEGLAAVEELVALGLNINITLLFSLKQYRGANRAYLQGIRRLVHSGGDARSVRSVASVFVSRMDTACDNLLEEKGMISLKGRAATANSQMIYAAFRQVFSSAEFRQLSRQGANAQRVLWASTGTKNPAYSDIKYVTELIGKETINTLPEETLAAFLDHGLVREALGENEGEAVQTVSELNRAGVDLGAVCAQLLQDGIVAFEKSFDTLLKTIEEKTGG